ncbi:nucleotide-binding domain-containing protein [Daldinia sp. FL1419]|nr:nucleotide-binding domain-containing protein [Daldinia sp. FL1419]
MDSYKTIAVVGAGVFGLSLAVALRKRGHNVTVFDQNRYDETRYQPGLDNMAQAASVDQNKIFRVSYGTKLHYQRLAMESRKGWVSLNTMCEDNNIFVNCGMLRVQHFDHLGALEKETLANMQQEGLHDTQFIKSIPADRDRAQHTHQTFEAVLDSLVGYTKSSEACAYFQKAAEAEGVKFHFGHEEGRFYSIRVIGLKTNNGVFHKADVVVIAGNMATFKINKSNTSLWDKYSPERFPVITWKSAARTTDGKDIVSFTNFQPAPKDIPFTQHGRWSIPLTPKESLTIPQPSIDAIRNFGSIFLPEFKQISFYSTKLFDYVPTYIEKSVFVCTGGSGYGAKFLPVLGEHAADILDKGSESSSYMRKFWRRRDRVPRGNKLEEGPDGPRNIGLFRLSYSCQILGIKQSG